MLLWTFLVIGLFVIGIKLFKKGKISDTKRNGFLLGLVSIGVPTLLIAILAVYQIGYHHHRSEASINRIENQYAYLISQKGNEIMVSIKPSDRSRYKKDNFDIEIKIDERITDEKMVIDSFESDYWFLHLPMRDKMIFYLNRGEE